MSLTAPETQWLVDVHDEHAAGLHRLVVLLGAEGESGHILRSALLSLGRRGNRVVDPVERVEYLQEQVVHHARSVRGPTGSLHLPEVADTRQQEILSAIARLPVKLGEALVISHYLSAFGPELAGILRMTVRASNVRLEDALDRLRRAVGDPTPGSLPGVIESLSQEVTAALRASGRLVRPPGTETLESELREFMHAGRAGLSIWVVVPLLVGSLFVGLWLATTLGAARTPSEPTVTPSSTLAPTATASRSLPAQVRSVPVYYVGRSDGKLYRELRDLAATGDLVQASLDALLALAPLDPDYDSLWGAGRLNSVELTGDQLQIDLSAAAFEGIAPAQVPAAIDQMVYTASEIMGDPELRVSFTLDGAVPPPGFTAQGGFGRTGLDPMPLLWLQSPKNGTALPAGQLVIVGTVKPGAAAPVVTILRADGTEVSSTTAQTATSANSEGWRAWSVSISDPLPPGGYSIVAATDLANAAGTRESASENRTITIS